MEESVAMLIAIPAFMLLILIELFVAKRQNKVVYRLKDAITNLNIGIGNQLIGILTKGLVLGALFLIYEHFAFFQLPINAFTALACLLLYEFLFYWSHRWSHEMNFFWGAHVVHHQSEEYNLAVALRQPWFHHLIMFFMFIPVPMLGFPPELFLPISLFSTLYQFWIHTRTIGKLPRWFEFIFNTPSHHRVHHGVNPKYIDKNHGAVLIIYDRIFGTFMEEEEEPDYGITKPFASWNPLWSNLHYYVEMWQLMLQIPRWQDKLKVILARPGWRPEELGGYQAPPPVAEDRQLFETKVRPPVQRYAAAQFFLMMFGIMAYLYYFNEMSLFFKLVFAGLQIVTLVIIGALFENKPWVRYVEHLRLLLVFAALNSIYYINYAAWFERMLVGSLIGLIGFGIWYTIRVFPFRSRV